MNAIELLKNDHQQLIAVMDQLETALSTQNSRRDELFQKFKHLFDKHDDAEDEIFYPALKGYNRLDKLVRKGYQAHHVVEVAILELRMMSYDNENWEPKFLVVKDSILLHLKEEETALFPEAETLLAAEKLNELGDKILKQRDKAFA